MHCKASLSHHSLLLNTITTTHILYGILSQENEQLLVTGLMYVI